VENVYQCAFSRSFFPLPSVHSRVRNWTSWCCRRCLFKLSLWPMACSSLSNPMLASVLLPRGVMQRVVACCNCCILLQCVTVYCFASFNSMLASILLLHVMSQCIAARCSVLQRRSTSCSVLQYACRHIPIMNGQVWVAGTLEWVVDTLQHTATHCNTLQNTAKHHTATHSNTL